jgi:pimeloyl-ACP methyl ester carboxylesterase
MLEKHVYVTKDGYINSLYRIPGRKGEKAAPGKPVVLYQHGLVDSCASILASEEESLGLKLVNMGYDLWMNNSRGNRYSRDHQLIDVDSCTHDKVEEFWAFSFQEMATYDQPAVWSYILEKTGQSQLTYIGHSQGTTQMFAALSENPEFFKPRLKKFIAIAPVLSVKNLGSLLLQNIAHDERALAALKAVGPEVMAKASGGDFIGDLVVGSKVGETISDKVISTLSDGDPESIDPIGKANHFKFYPAGGCYQ